MAGYKKDCPQAVRIIKDLMLNAQQEAVKYKAARDWVSLAGHDAAFKVEHNQKPLTLEELQGQVVKALGELSSDEAKNVIRLLAKNGQVSEIQSLMTLPTDNPQ
jgi:hypothetical protein